MVTKKELTKTNEIKDPYVLQFCSQRILEYTERLNSKNIEHWTVKEVVEFLASGNDDVCFSDYARKHINRMIDNGQQRNAKNYQLALQTSGAFFRNNADNVLTPYIALDE